MKTNILRLLFTFLTLAIVPMSVFANIANNDDPTDLYNLGIDYYSQNQVQKSMECFKKAVKLDPDFYEAYYNLAQIQASYGYVDNAINNYKKVVDLRPNDYDSIYELAKLLYDKKLYNESSVFLKRIPNNSSIYSSAVVLQRKIDAAQPVAYETETKDEAQTPKTLELYPGQKVADIPVVTEYKNTMTSVSKVNSPSGICTDSDGNIYVASFSENKIYKIATNYKKTIYVQSDLIKGPIGIAMDENNNLYIANYMNNNILKISKSLSVNEIAKVNKPYCVDVDNKQGVLVITEQDTNNIFKIKL